MSYAKYLISQALIATAVLGITCINTAQAEEYVSKAKAKTLHQAPLPGVQGKEVIIKHYTLPPKYVGGRHYHPGPVYVYILKGEFSVRTENGTKTYKAGELYPEPLNKPMQARNVSTSDDIELVVFQIGDIGKPMMIKAR